MNDAIILATIRYLYVLSRDGARCDAGSIALRLGISPIRVGQALLHLEGKGLADAGRVRLTLRGLAIAAPLVAAAEQSPASRGRAA